jgi:hypothetical protein
MLRDPAGFGVSWTDLLCMRRWYACAFIVGGSHKLASIFNSFINGDQ